MSADYKELEQFTKNLEKLNEKQKDEFLQSCCKELAARLLEKVIKRTPSQTGVLRRGWTAGKSGGASSYAQSLNVRHSGNTYQVEIINPIEYASYVEYGHRTRGHRGWVQGHFMLTISEEEINRSTERILTAKLKKYMKEVFT